MGLDIHGTRFLLYAKLLGADFSRPLMIGRQGLHLSPAALRANLVRLGVPFTDEKIDTIFAAEGGYAEEFLRFLGAGEVHSLDNSAYEGASHVEDLNREVPDSFKARYSLVLDGGSLEHIFNFPMALANCMEMVAVGGHYLAITPANNFMGHGFYQFSPELFLSVFTDANGFRLERLIAFEDRPRAPWYRILKPEFATKRIMSLHSRPVYLLVLARRTRAAPALRSMPQQSDYVAIWEADGTPAPTAPRQVSGRSAPIRAALRIVPESIKQRAKVLLGFKRRRRRFDPRFFRKMALEEELGELRRVKPDSSDRPSEAGSEVGDGE